ncbi:hypothetical protein REPUB_Repub17cG0027500 [Reevesia pubescens]
MSLSKEHDPDDSGASSSFRNVFEPVVMEVLDTKIQKSETIDEPDPDDGEAQLNILKCSNIARHDPRHHITTETLEDLAHLNQGHKEPDPDETKANEIAQAEHHPDDKLLPQLVVSDMKIEEPIWMIKNYRESKTLLLVFVVVCKRPFRCCELKNVIEHPDEMKFRRLRKCTNNMVRERGADSQVSIATYEADSWQPPSGDVVKPTINKAYKENG